MNITDTKIPAVKLIEPKVFGDERGFFMETWNEKAFREAGINETFVQDNHSRSVKNTLRGLHYQIKQPQGKLVRVTRGEVFDVAVDLRTNSPTFGQWVGEYLSEENKRMLWVPPGFAHGFLVTSETADFQYKCTDFYAPEYERSIIWSDPEIGVQWGGLTTDQLLLSGKDSEAMSLEAATPELREIYSQFAL
ncbi:MULTISPECIES: dTDP-4-dehydrorhamnose 3,5-epimerase [Gammaproteobacteria]|jgi:dTDP-4-dehydrorhamnose 3,5-epimerase|uniref:dTDP-4-dehydrorhamnose 3,5-epimerase n=1 Tax=Gammaproteobacteria TaxID=1236 RepID=UPI000C3E29C1|nr:MULTISPECIES: dTDP-4-dehydrorhamnose 3,5-epimerase [Gammaproteobacteria]MBU73755.1 dTDP-4-dehydrorhamnose 3,5-epimerase [Spongiibacter sp.]HCP20355.1 dTDP-4-dehydrorhamnose 3,5-epimerase [Marinobacter nauticus]|tara:strand:+ start:2747 stop:3322 length:576 start_codon:yes stop_codon:yes gene_type:complete